MSKSAQQRFNELLAESHETSDAVREMVNASFEHRRNFGFACGVLESLLKDAIAELPRARRAEFREQLYEMAQAEKNAQLAEIIKEA